MRSQRTRHLLVDLALWALLSGPVLLLGDPDDGGSWGGAAAGVGLLGVAALVWRRVPLLSLGIALALTAARNTELFASEYVLSMAAFGYLAGRRSPRARPALVFFGSVAAAGLVALLLLDRDPWAWPAQLGSLLFTVVVPWLVGRYVLQYAELIRTGWQLAERMEREQRAVADRERMRERSRIAGDMHDSLGHDLSLIAVRAAALEVDPALSESRRAAAGELRRAAADATARLRDIVGVLRADDERAPTAPADESVRELVERARESGIAVRLREDGVPRALPGMTDRAVHRVVQESLTNAAKHAPGAAVVVGVERAAGWVLVVVESGRAEGPPSGQASGGSGLVGLDERVRLAGGTLDHGPRPDGGFTVTARLPVTAGATPPPPEPRVPSTASGRALRQARGRVRRGLAQAIVIPVAGVGVLAVLLFAADQYTRARSVPDRAQYERIGVGDTRAEVSARLPEHALDGRPAGVDPEPAGAGSCVYYRVGRFSDAPAYRLCFRDGRLASKAVVTDVANEEDRP
ncbi:sensor histidine kinase [Streptomyces sp. NPDC001985]|uniref:sensor histidine kinase n=1 Tax=Streptomyces sp. NPDC001985 TaxID=3154406 RepID=UPI0033270B8E